MSQHTETNATFDASLAPGGRGDDLCIRNSDRKQRRVRFGPAKIIHETATVKPIPLQNDEIVKYVHTVPFSDGKNEIKINSDTLVETIIRRNIAKRIKQSIDNENVCSFENSLCSCS
jgi:hypothetical protein